MIVKALLFGFAIFFFIRMIQYRKRIYLWQKTYDKLSTEKSKLSDSVRKKGIAIERLERKNRDLQNELEDK